MEMIKYKILGIINTTMQWLLSCTPSDGQSARNSTEKAEETDLGPDRIKERSF